jgi:hypothetical protein
MKHIKLFENSESDLLRDLKNVGFERLESLFIQTISKAEGSFDCWIVVAKNEDQMIEMLLDVDMVSPVAFGVRASYTGSSKRPQSVVDLLAEISRKDEYDMADFKIFRGLELRSSVNTPMLVSFIGNDFYKSITLLETYYTNIREVMEQQLKSEWGNNLYVQKWQGK